MIFKFIVLSLSFALFLSAEMHLRTKVAMGTFISISLEEKHKKHLENAFAIVYDVENSLSSYKPEALIYQLNHNAKVDLDTYSYEAFLLSQNYYEKTEAYFDITIGSITKDLYRFGEKEVLPSSTNLQNAFVDFRGLSFSRKKASILKGIKIDLGGMGKGYAVDKVSEYLKSQSIRKGIIAASGDIFCFDSCKIEVADPFSEQSILSFTTKGKDTSVSTSGNYNRYVISTKHNHLINPKQKRPQENFISITLISKLANSDLDAYATAASVMPREKAYRFLKKQDLAYIIMQDNKNLYFSDNLSKYLRDLIIYDRVKK